MTSISEIDDQIAEKCRIDKKPSQSQPWIKVNYFQILLRRQKSVSINMKWLLSQAFNSFVYDSLKVDCVVSENNISFNLSPVTTKLHFYYFASITRPAITRSRLPTILRAK